MMIAIMILILTLLTPSAIHGKVEMRAIKHSEEKQF